MALCTIATSSATNFSTEVSVSGFNDRGTVQIMVVDGAAGTASVVRKAWHMCLLICLFCWAVTYHNSLARASSNTYTRRPPALFAALCYLFSVFCFLWSFLLFDTCLHLPSTAAQQLPSTQYRFPGVYLCARPACCTIFAHRAWGSVGWRLTAKLQFPGLTSLADCASVSFPFPFRFERSDEDKR